MHDYFSSDLSEHNDEELGEKYFEQSFEIS